VCVALKALYRQPQLINASSSAVKVLGDETLRTIARELVKTVHANVTIDWTLRENVRAQLRVMKKRAYRRPGDSFRDAHEVFSLPGAAP